MISEQIDTDDLGELKPTVAGRLLFFWFAFVAALWTVPMAILQFLSHQFSPTAKNFKRTATIWGRVILRLAGIRVHVTDRARLDPSLPYVFVSNHQNLLDILALSDALPYPFGFVAKEDLARVPFLGFAIRNSACVFIDKRDPRRAIVSLREAGERIRGGNSVLIFVEGTRSYSAGLQPFKKGAFAVAVEAGVAMVPVTITNAFRLMHEKKRLVRPGVIDIVVGRPISLEGKTRRNVPELMDAVRESLQRELGDEKTRIEGRESKTPINRPEDLTS